MEFATLPDRYGLLGVVLTASVGSGSGLSCCSDQSVLQDELAQRLDPVWRFAAQLAAVICVLVLESL